MKIKVVRREQDFNTTMLRFHYWLILFIHKEHSQRRDMGVLLLPRSEMHWFFKNLECFSINVSKMVHKNLSFIVNQLLEFDAENLPFRHIIRQKYNGSTIWILGRQKICLYWKLFNQKCILGKCSRNVSWGNQIASFISEYVCFWIWMKSSCFIETWKVYYIK